MDDGGMAEEDGDGGEQWDEQRRERDSGGGAGVYPARLAGGSGATGREGRDDQ